MARINMEQQPVPLSADAALRVLGLQPGASPAQVRAAYKRLAIKTHPDKQQQQRQQQPSQQQEQQQQQQQQQQVLPPFSAVVAAYSLLTSCNSGDLTATDWPSFEAAYASGALFTDELIDEALRCGMPPDAITHLETLCDAAAKGELAASLAASPPTKADEAVWRHLHRRVGARTMLRAAPGRPEAQHRRIYDDHEQQQQQQHIRSPDTRSSVGLGELLSDVLLRPHGRLLVEVSSDAESDDGGEHDLQLQQQQQLPEGKNIEVAREGSSQPRLRRGLAWWWLIARRMMLARAVLALLRSSGAQRRDRDYFHDVY